MKKRITFIIFLALVSVMSQAAIITLKSGKKVQGEVLINNAEVVIVRDNMGARFQYPASEVISVENNAEQTTEEVPEVEEKKPQGKKVAFLLGIGEGVAFVPNEQVDNMLTGELLIGSRNIGKKSIFLGGGLSVNTFFNISDKTNYVFLPLQVAVKVPFIEGKHSPFVGANLGYGFGLSRNTVGGLFTSAEIGYRYLANSRISLYVSVRAQFQQATISAKTVIDGTTFNNQAGRNFVTLGAHFGFSF